MESPRRLTERWPDCGLTIDYRFKAVGVRFKHQKILYLNPYGTLPGRRTRARDAFLSQKRLLALARSWNLCRPAGNR